MPPQAGAHAVTRSLFAQISYSVGEAYIGSSFGACSLRLSYKEMIIFAFALGIGLVFLSWYRLLGAAWSNGASVHLLPASLREPTQDVRQFVAFPLTVFSAEKNESATSYVVLRAAPGGIFHFRDGFPFLTSTTERFRYFRRSILCCLHVSFSLIQLATVTPR